MTPNPPGYGYGPGSPAGGYPGAPGAGNGDPRRQVDTPGLLLMIMGGLGVILGLLSVAFSMLGLGLSGLSNLGSPEMDQMMSMVSGTVGIISSLISVAANGVILYGGMQMRNLQSYGLALAAAIISIIPVTCCCCLGIPLGIWALVILLREDVKAAFTS